MRNKNSISHLGQHEDELGHKITHFEPNIKLKKLKQSNELLYNKIKAKSRTKSHSTQSYNVLVTSKQEEDLMSFIHSKKLPKLTPLTSRKKSPLEQILRRKENFKKNYFGEIHHFHKYEEKEEITYEFGKVRVGEYTVSGYIMGKYVLLKGVSKKRWEKIKKYKYEEVYKEIRNNYEKWVEEEFAAES